METYVTVVYVIVDEVLKILNAKDEPNSKMSDAEVLSSLVIKLVELLFESYFVYK